jgi:hypothetical protein
MSEQGGQHCREPLQRLGSAPRTHDAFQCNCRWQRTACSGNKRGRLTTPFSSATARCTVGQAPSNTSVGQNRGALCPPTSDRPAARAPAGRAVLLWSAAGRVPTRPAAAPRSVRRCRHHVSQPPQASTCCTEGNWRQHAHRYANVCGECCVRRSVLLWKCPKMNGMCNIVNRQGDSKLARDILNLLLWPTVELQLLFCSSRLGGRLPTEECRLLGSFGVRQDGLPQRLAALDRLAAWRAC